MTKAELQAELDRLNGYLNSCIWIDPARQSGSPCLGGTRIPVDCIATAVRVGETELWYPQATPEHVATVEWWLQQPGVKKLLRMAAS